MPTRARTVAVVATVALTLLAACGDDDTDGAAASSTTVSTTTSPTSSSTTGATPTSGPAATTTTAAPEPDVHVVTVAFAGGEVAGGLAEVTVPAGERVRLEVTSDVEEEVHVHGYDLKQPVGPGRPARFDFVADLPGIWEVELEGSGAELVRLRVQG